MIEICGKEKLFLLLCCDIRKEEKKRRWGWGKRGRSEIDIYRDE